MKYCPKCKETKPFESFYKSKNRKDGYDCYCRDCHAIWREENKDKVSLGKKKYYELNKETLSEKRKEQYKLHGNKWRETQQAYYTLPENRLKKIYWKAKERAISEGMEFTISLDDIIIPEYCPYLKCKLTHDLGKGQLKTNSSLDRIDSTKGYVPGNVQVISRLANTMKSNATEQEQVFFALGVLEGIEGTTLERYTNAFKSYLESLA